jgi:hypothetical protein
VEFQIWRGNGSKIQVKLSFTIHPSHERQQLDQHFMLKQLIKTYVDLYKKFSPIAPLQLCFFGEFELAFKKWRFTLLK